MKGDFSRWTFDLTKHFSAVLDQQGRVKTDADKLEEVEITSHQRQETRRDIVGVSGAPVHNPGFGLRPNNRGQLIIGAGKYYVDGILCENEQNISFTEQPDLPGQVLPSIEGDTRRFLAYLDVWERHITAIEDPDIREVALGGPDTTTRKQTVCQVKLIEVDADVHCLSSLPEWEQAIESGDDQLSARASPSEDADDLCLIPPDAGFTGLENQLYRVEIHQGGEPGEATFMWDRDNGYIALPIEEFLDGLPANRVGLGSVGKSDIHSLNPGDDLLEITDDIRELNGEPGLLRRAESSEPATGIVTLDEQVDGLSQGHHPKVRRWSGGAETIVSVDTFIPLENGVEVRFEGDQFRTGDYWLIPSRTATRDVEWPTQDDEPLPRPPLGVKHHYCRLALLDFGGGDFNIIADCRTFFQPLSQNSLRITGVQTATNNQVLPHDSSIRPDSLTGGLNIQFSAPLSENVLTTLDDPGIDPAIQVQLYLPEPSSPDEREFWGLDANEFFGFRPVSLASSISFVNDQGDGLQWRPNEPARIWLRQLFSRLVSPGQARPAVDRILGTLQVRGDHVWANGPEGDQVFLDGEATVNPLRRAGLDLPSGNGQRGGDFVISFWVVADDVEVPLTLFVDVRLNVVSGVVSSGGASVESATVTLILNSGPGAGSQQTTESDAEGRFSFTALEGDYTVIAEALGATAEQDVEVGPVIVSPGGGGGVPGGPRDLSVREINGIGPRFTQLLATNGVTRVAEFVSLSPSRIAEILPSVSEERARELITNARRLLEG